ncbi:MAG: LytTR family DNA-binding domain-containing protein [Bacteroidota bacterium]
MTCIIIEDQPPAQRILKKYIADIGSLELKGTFPDAIQALTFLQIHTIDLIFLDIHLPKISGIDFLKTLPHPPKIILTTAFSDYALESYEFNVVDYLLKPFSFQRFVKAIAKVKQTNQAMSPVVTSDNETRSELFIKSGYEHIKISVNEILYIKSDADYTELHLPNRKHLSPEPLRHWLSLLDNQQFTRVHKSYIVNTAKMEKIIGNQIHLVDRKIVPIGRAYKEDFMERFVR